MAETFSFGELETNLTATMEDRVSQSKPESDTPFRIALLGDFSGRANRRLPPSSLAKRRAHYIDRDNFDDVLAKLQPQLNLTSGDEATSLTITFNSLDDFHPDRIYTQLQAFQSLREMRERIDNPKTFDEAAREVRGWLKDETPVDDRPAPEPEITNIGAPRRETGISLLDQMLDDAEGQSAPASAPAPRPSHDSELSSFLRHIVTPHLVPGDDAQQEELIEALDGMTTQLMKAVLHHPEFQALESAWRAVYFLTSNLETGTDLKIYLIDLSKEELAADLANASNLRDTGTYRLLVEQTTETLGSAPWAVLAGNYVFDLTRADAELLGRMGKVASRSGAPFIAMAHPHHLGCESLAETPDANDWQTQSVGSDAVRAWTALRQLSESVFLGLALPRFLLRLPYGSKTDAIEQFAFEETSGNFTHEDYLWANPAFLCAYLLAQSFSASGWNFGGNVAREIEGLPLHIYTQEGESHVKPCAEVLLTERSAEKILDRGLMPLISYRERDVVRLARLQSIADPPASLQGRWS